MQKIFFHSADKSPSRLLHKTKLKQVIEQIFKKEQILLDSLNYVFCSDEYLLQINRQFLNHDFYTDIITFDLSEKGGAVIGEIYISIDRVKDNAATLGNTFHEELLRVLLHGALHLCGYKDKKKAEIIEMRKTEEQYLRLLKRHISK
jgi:rRNA maturation RNase YbeY